MATSMKKLSPLELWKRGNPISKAWLEFAPANLRQKYDEPKLSRRTPWKGLSDLLATIPEDDRRRKVKKAGLQLQQYTENDLTRSRLSKNMQHTCLERSFDRVTN